MEAENKPEFMESNPREGSKQPEKSQEFRQLQEEANYRIPPMSGRDDLHPTTILCIPPCSLPSATCPALTSQPIQLSHPTVLVLLGNDLKNRERETAVEECQMTTCKQARNGGRTQNFLPTGEGAVPGGLQLPDCVHNEELLSSLLPMP